MYVSSRAGEVLRIIWDGRMTERRTEDTRCGRGEEEVPNLECSFGGGPKLGGGCGETRNETEPPGGFDDEEGERTMLEVPLTCAMGSEFLIWVKGSEIERESDAHNGASPHVVPLSGVVRRIGPDLADLADLEVVEISDVKGDVEYSLNLCEERPTLLPSMARRLIGELIIAVSAVRGAK